MNSNVDKLIRIYCLTNIKTFYIFFLNYWPIIHPCLVITANILDFMLFINLGMYFDFISKKLRSISFFSSIMLGNCPPRTMEEEFPKVCQLDLNQGYVWDTPCHGNCYQQFFWMCESVHWFVSTNNFQH